MQADQNPFRVDQIHSLPYRFSDGRTTDQLVCQLCQDFGKRTTHTAIVGPHGFGKTTLLKEIEGQLRRSGYRTYWLSAASLNGTFSAWTGYSSLFKSIESIAIKPTAIESARNDSCSTQPNAGCSAETVVFVDSGECVKGFAWWRLLRSLQNVHLITTLHRPRRIPTLVQCEPDAKLFLQHCHELMDRANFNELREETILGIYRDCNQNSRDAFFRLYEFCAQLEIT